MFFFQIPALPEFLAARNNFETNVQALRTTSRPGTFSDDELQHYREAWSQPGALTGAINWYRGLFRAAPATPPDMRVHVPTLMIWGAQDRFLGQEMAQPCIAMCDDGRLEIIAEASHWVQHEEADRVNQLIYDFWRE
jgi:pimeloyl-ACP methyl ester carboxylesterase